MTAEYGAATQLEKIDMLDFADVIAINKFDKRGSLDALRDVRRAVPAQPQPVRGRRRGAAGLRHHRLAVQRPRRQPPLRGAGRARLDELAGRAPLDGAGDRATSRPHPVIPPERVRYLAEIVENSRAEDRRIAGAVRAGQPALPAARRRSAELRGARAGGPRRAARHWRPPPATRRPACAELVEQYRAPARRSWRPTARRLLEEWPALVERYRADEFRYEVRDKVIAQPLVTALAQRHAHPAGLPAALARLGRHPALAADRERARAATRTPPASSRSSARARIPRACSPARAAPSAPTTASTTCRWACPRSACPRRSTR